jgi:hypothetical protein
LLTNAFACDQLRNHATRAGTLCSSIKMREELTAVRRADRSSAVLSARPRRGNERDASTKRDAHRRMSSADMFARDPRQKFRRIQHTLRPCSKFVKLLLNSSEFLYTGWPLGPHLRASRCSQYFSSFKQYLGFLGGVLNSKNLGISICIQIYLGIFRCI